MNQEMKSKIIELEHYQMTLHNEIDTISQNKKQELSAKFLEV